MAENGHTNGVARNGEAPPSKKTKGWTVPTSQESKGAINSIRQCEEKHFRESLDKRDTSKELIKLSIGDPTVFGNLPPHPVVVQALKSAADSGRYDGYGHSQGLIDLRRTLAEKFSTVNESPLTANDVIVTSACSGALDIAIGTLSNAGQNILTPSPGFALYRCLVGAKLVEQRLYRTLPDRNWEIDLDHLEHLVDCNTAAIIINTPNNPCGSVYSKAHLRDIANFAARHRLPIISDEIYAEMVFTGHTFHSMAAVATDVPVLVCGGMAKRYLIPGWRIGWILIHDPIGAFEGEVREGLSQMAQKILGPSTIIQGAMVDIINSIPASFHQRNIAVFEENASLVYAGLQTAPGLTPVLPSGAMYMMIGINIDRYPDFKDDIDFTKQLVMEESVFCLPGQALECANYFRVVLVMPKDKIKEACDRIVVFCQRHYH